MRKSNGNGNDSIQSWLKAHTYKNNIYHLSKDRNFTYDPYLYDKQYKISPDDLSNGKGLLNIVKTRNIDLTYPAWEIGCGTGSLSLGFAKLHNFPNYLISDMSSEFLYITKQKLDTMCINSDRYTLAVYDADAEYTPPPEQSFSLITLRATLHHILHPENFIKKCLLY